MLEIGHRKVNARVYACKIRFQFLRTLTCVDKNATVEIHLKADESKHVLCACQTRIIEL